MICATIEGPYQSPAFFPELLPNSTSWCIPKGAVELSANHDTTRLCVASMGLSSREPKLSARRIFLCPSFKLCPVSARQLSRSMSSLTTRWQADQVQSQNDGKKNQCEYCTMCLRHQISSWNGFIMWDRQIPLVFASVNSNSLFLQECRNSVFHKHTQLFI